MQKVTKGEEGGIDGDVEGEGEGKVEVGEGEEAAERGGAGCVSLLPSGNCNVAARLFGL